MRSGLTALVVAAAGAGVLAAASLVGAPESVVEEYPEVQEPVVRSSPVCPFVGGEEEGRAHIGVYSLPDVPAVAEDDPDPITARELAFTPEPGATPEPSPEPTEPAEPLLTVDGRGVFERLRVETDEGTSVAVEGTGSLAPGLVAEQSMVMEEIDLRGLSTAACSPAAREHWFVGGSGEVGKRGRLVLANPTSVAAVVNIRLWDEAGPIDAPATQGIGVPARSQHVLLLDALAPDSERVGVEITTTQGRVSAALEVRETDETTPLGMSFVPEAQAPDHTVVIPAVPDHGEPVLRVLAPGSTDAIVSVRMFGANGPFAPIDHEVITVPAGSVSEIELDGLNDEPVAIELDSDEPITASVRAVDDPDDGLPDLAFTAATPPLSGPTAALLGRTSSGFSSTLHISSVAEASTRVTIKTLDDDGAVDSEEELDIPGGATVPFELERADDASFATVLVEPAQPGAIVVGREMSAEDDQGAYFDLLPLRSPAIEVAVPRVVGELPSVLDRSED
ncbi:DUF5719 family protein [Phytoactinopolyspora mesophila]|uniref:Secreted protein n=1 Tax=Phytoactinopolyspora mesophila TaxID=2650750 RepID=A0A7K3M284_9ACTN|nr:DUF5719 family protein [Phytoactinopolyspora mesophila]NDL57403.1 hypothetical protein [Phytoactinopolyspora mesophila]